MNTTATCVLLLAAALPVAARAELADNPGAASTNLLAVTMRFAEDAGNPPAPPRLVPVTMHELQLQLEPTAEAGRTASLDRDGDGLINLRRTLRTTPLTAETPAPVEITRRHVLDLRDEAGDDSATAAGTSWGWLADDVQRRRDEEALAAEMEEDAMADWEERAREEESRARMEPRQDAPLTTWQEDATSETEDPLSFGSPPTTSATRADDPSLVESQSPGRTPTDSAARWETPRNGAAPGEAPYELPEGHSFSASEDYTLPTPAEAPLSGLQDDSALAPFGPANDNR